MSKHGVGQPCVAFAFLISRAPFCRAEFERSDVEVWGE